MTHDDPHSKAADAVHEGRPVEAQYTRQGRPGVRILWLLIVSAGAAAVLLLGMWFVSQGGFSNTNANDGGQAVDARADIYSLGCMLFELLTGKVPYSAATPNDLLNKHVSAAVPAVSAVNPNATTTVTDLLRKMLAKKPADRPATMQEVLRQLRAIRLLERATIA